MTSFDKGIVMPLNNQNSDTWDDTEILSAFETAIKNHRTKNQIANEEVKKRKDASTRALGAAAQCKDNGKLNKARGGHSSASGDIGGNSGSSSMAHCLNAYERVTGSEQKDGAIGNGKRQKKGGHGVNSGATSGGGATTRGAASFVKKLSTDGVATNVAVYAAEDSSTGDGGAINNSGGKDETWYQYEHGRQQGGYDYQQHQPSTAHSFPPTSSASEGGIHSGAVLEDAMNAMLMAWYHSGYATGRYQTLLELQKQQEQGNTLSHDWQQKQRYGSRQQHTNSTTSSEQTPLCKERAPNGHYIDSFNNSHGNGNNSNS